MPLESVTTPVRKKLYCAIVQFQLDTSSTVVQSHIDNHYIHHILLIYYTPIYSLWWSTNGPPQSHNHRTSVPGNSRDISTRHSSPIWCMPVSSRSSTTRRWREISMTEKSSGISRANSTDLYISMVGYDSTIQTEVDV